MLKISFSDIGERKIARDSRPSLAVCIVRSFAETLPLFRLVTPDFSAFGAERNNSFSPLRATVRPPQ
jgi:hypothetical protein